MPAFPNQYQLAAAERLASDFSRPEKRGRAVDPSVSSAHTLLLLPPAFRQAASRHCMKTLILASQDQQACACEARKFPEGEDSIQVGPHRPRWAAAGVLGPQIHPNRD